LLDTWLSEDEGSAAMAIRGKTRRLAVITGASTGLGLDLARMCAQQHYDLVIAGPDRSILDAAEQLAASGVRVRPVQCDLSGPEGVDTLGSAIGACGQPVAMLIANAGREVIERDMDQLLRDAQAYIDGIIYLIDRVSRLMRDHGRGRILVTYSMAAWLAASGGAALPADREHRQQAVLDYFSSALYRVLRSAGVRVGWTSVNAESASASLTASARSDFPRHPTALPGELQQHRLQRVIEQQTRQGE
jgi:NAD(P)-dependent dehydrogenase (short-subunit alcohol dehydrogenase family)